MNQEKPDWIKIKLSDSDERKRVGETLRRNSLRTVCEDALCPNLYECFGRKTAAFLILGKNCTRHCTFCNIKKGAPQPVDHGEPANIAEAVAELGLAHAVITSVTRDDLPDFGAAHFADVITALRRQNDRLIIEVLIPDFKGCVESLRIVTASRPHIINHNIETVPRLYPEIRPEASYTRSLDLINQIQLSDKRIYSKSGIMLGLGERESEVVETMKDIRKAGSRILTIGQYLSPSSAHHPVAEYVHPDVFEDYREIGMAMGFEYVASAPLVRSSYYAGAIFDAIKGIET